MATTAHIITYNIHGLPWCRNYVKEVAAWLLEQRPAVICLQEVFTARARQEFQTVLSAAGYTVLVPHDADVCWLPSGLLTAVDTRVYRVVSHCFQAFLDYHNVEILANKGFFRVHLEQRGEGGGGVGGVGSTSPPRRFHIINTHTQSDTEAAWIFGRAITKRIRHKQATQILEAAEHLPDPVIVIGDLNQETSLHPHLRFLHPPSELPIRKATFFKTGEDLDHVAWLPVQWAPPGCGFCGIIGPRLDVCRVHTVPWSDHAPVEVMVNIPPLPHRDGIVPLDNTHSRSTLDRHTMVVGLR